MTQKTNNQFLLVLAISLALIACNSGDKETETTSTDSSGATKTETAPTTTDATMDAVNVAPALYKVLKDSMGIRIVEATYKPGDSSALHSHHDYAVYVAEGGTATYYAKDGTKMEAARPSGWTTVRASEVHGVKNTGKTTLRVILVEVNRPMKAGTWDNTLDATKVSPDLYKSKSDSLGIRVIEVMYKPGQSSPSHSHPDAALYVTQGSTAEFTGKDGSKRVVEMPKGAAIVVPSDTHTVKNIGKTTMKGVLVEVNRAVN